MTVIRILQQTSSESRACKIESWLLQISRASTEISRGKGAGNPFPVHPDACRRSSFASFPGTFVPLGRTRTVSGRISLTRIASFRRLFASNENVVRFLAALAVYLHRNPQAQRAARQGGPSGPGLVLSVGRANSRSNGDAVQPGRIARRIGIGEYDLVCSGIQVYRNHGRHR